MKQFFTSFFASLLAILVAGFLIFIIFFAILIGSIVNLAGAGSEKAVYVKSGTVLRITLDKEITERSPNNPFGNFSFGASNRPLGLNDVLNNIKKAEADNNISGIFLDLSSISAGFATVEEIRNALLHFKKSGKFTIAYSEIGRASCRERV